MSDTEGPPSAGPRRIYGMDRILRIESHSPWIARKRDVVQGGISVAQASYQQWNSGDLEARSSVLSRSGCLGRPSGLRVQRTRPLGKVYVSHI